MILAPCRGMGLRQMRALLVALLTLLFAQQASAREIKISHQWPAERDARDRAVRIFAAEVTKRVPGITFAIYPNLSLNLKAVMLFLFAGEMIASTDGLAYRIALLRRHMGMDVIIPYVLWVALLLFLVDVAMRLINRKLHPWFREA